MDAVEVVEIADKADLDAAFAIRRAVFCVEQGVDPAEEFDGRDPECRLYIARQGIAAIGTARLRRSAEGEFKIERVAVVKQMRGRGIGRALMARTIADARAAGTRRIVIHAQRHAERFYAVLGFCAEGPTFDEAGIPHVKMTLQLRAFPTTANAISSIGMGATNAHDAPPGAVLIVEDERLVSETIAEFLRRRGFVVVQEFDAPGALRAMTESDPAIVLLDVGLGDVSGISVLRQAAERGKRPPTLVMSGDDRSLGEAVDPGLNILRTLNKPIPLRQLETFLRKYLSV